MSVIAFGPDDLRDLPTLPPTHGCDFCASNTAAWRYSARDTGLGMIVYGGFIGHAVSVGGWRACDDCSILIEDGDYPALGRRTLGSLSLDLSRSRPGTRVKMLAAFHQAHEAFRRARSGPREALA